MKIIKIVNSSCIDIEFQDSHHYVRQTTYNNFKTGGISNPYFPTVCNIGYHGVGKFATNNNCVEYVTWKDMLERCYSEKDKNDHMSYFGISEVCDEWHNFQNFGNWFEENYYEVDERLHLDKDILYPGNKLYSPYHCLLVPQKINMLFMNKPNKRGLPNGIDIAKSGNFEASYRGKHLGTYSTLEEAYESYSNAKEKRIKEMADEYKNIIPKRVYDALYAYKVDIRNDKNYKQKVKSIGILKGEIYDKMV